MNGLIYLNSKNIMISSTRELKVETQTLDSSHIISQTLLTEDFKSCFFFQTFLPSVHSIFLLYVSLFKVSCNMQLQRMTS